MTKTWNQAAADEGIVITHTGDDKGTLITNGQFAAGTQDAPVESVFGAGDSYPVPYAFHYNGAVYTDISEILQSDSGSTTPLFGGIAVGNEIYFGSDYVFHGLKTKTETAGVLLPTDYVLEEWTGAAWQDWGLMATDALPPKRQWGWAICNTSSNSEQWRFGANPLDWTPPRTKTTVNGVEAYWWRMRIVNAITTDPIIQQLKCSPSRVELDSFGQEWYGQARRREGLLNHLQLAVPAAGFSPSDGIVSFSPDIVLSMSNNRFRFNAKDGLGGVGVFPTGIDTSVPLEYNITFQPKTAGTGNVELSVTAGIGVVGGVLDNTGPQFEQTVVIPMDGTLNKLYEATFVLDARFSLPGFIQSAIVFRDGTADSYGGDIVLVTTATNGYFWR